MSTQLRVAVYARVSSSDKEQDTESQLTPVRRWLDDHQDEYRVTREYVDRAKATDLRRRTAWRELMDDAARGGFDVVIVFKLDRAFRSAQHMYAVLGEWRMHHVDIFAVQDGFDTNTAYGRLHMGFLALIAEFELEQVSDRIKAGLERASKHGTKSGRDIGRPTSGIDPNRVKVLRSDGKSWREIARLLKSSARTVQRVWQNLPAENGSHPLRTDGGK